MTTTLKGGSLTDEQVALYQEEGYLVLPKLLTDADLAPAREAMMQKVDEIANELNSDGLVTETYPESPFESRL
ncbi:MAG TPA: hypothetical protein VFW40_09230, partial [Capsulimonadaceae bacterium]|nr:hypothetical protein [Capsulimonadaceae bacterium]